MKIRRASLAIAVAVAFAQSGYAEDSLGGGTFGRPEAAKSVVENAGLPTKGLPSSPSLVFDRSGKSNELIVRFRGEQPGWLVDVRRLDSSESHASFERAVVASVREGDPVTRRALRGALRARSLTEGMRMSSQFRKGLRANSARERLEQFIVLRYPSVEAATQAKKSLEQDPGVAWVGHNEKMEFSWAPNDRYFSPGPAPSNAGQYQWGMQAMNFPSAWDTTTGSAYVASVDTGLENGVPPPDLTQNYRSHFSFHLGAGWFTPSEPAYPFHGTHVLGIIGATANNSSGVAGGCPNCSLATVRTTLDSANLAAALVKIGEIGMQVLNLSLNNNSVTSSCPPEDQSTSCVVVAPALEFLAERDVLVVASSGNSNMHTPAFPATMPSVLAVAGAQSDDPLDPTAWSLWTSGSWGIPRQETGSNGAGQNGVMAPAKSIVSTVPIHAGGMFYNAGDGIHDCSDQADDNSGVVGDGYATCTGTSMAAPHVSALAGLVRSADPLRSAEEVRSVIRSSGSQASSPEQTHGYGMPDAGAAVDSMFGTWKNRLTPLFSFYSMSRQDFFYTTVPQMATAAIWGTLEPRRDSTSVIDHTTAATYGPWGQAVSGYDKFPDHRPGVGLPRAEVWIFTTSHDPKHATVPLVPLYRMSWKCGDPTPVQPDICAHRPEHMDTVYTTEQAGIDAFGRVGYKLDGIEGYIYSKRIGQPAGTERLMRKYNPVRDDHAIFPESRLRVMTALGYTVNSGSDWLGYVYPNTAGKRPVIK